MKDKEPNYDDNFKGLGNYNNESLSREDILYPTMRDKESNYDFFFNGLGNYGNKDIQRKDSLFPIRKNKKDEGILTGGAASIDAVDNTLFSDKALKKTRSFITKAEDFKADAYKDQAGKWTIGYGHTGKVDGKEITAGMKITPEKAEELYRKDFEIHTAPLKDVQVPLTNNQKIALASFLYNLGPNILKGSDMLKKLNKGDYEGAANEFDKYIHQKNKKTGKYEVLNGLIDRRAKEKKLFLTPDGE